MFGLSLPLLLGGALFALIAIGGMNACSYQKGKDSRDPEVSRLTLEKDSAVASNASLQRDIDAKNAIITRQNAEVARLETIGKSVRGLQATIRQESAARVQAQQATLTSLDATAKAGAEPGLACPKTYGILGEAADLAREGMPAAPQPAKPAPVIAPQPPASGPPKPVLPPKPLPPAIRLK